MKTFIKLNYQVQSSVSSELSEENRRELAAVPRRPATGGGGGKRQGERERITEAVTALALCHNVTPVYEETSGAGGGAGDEDGEGGGQSSLAESDRGRDGPVSYQVSKFICHQSSILFDIYNYSHILFMPAAIY